MRRPLAAAAAALAVVLGLGADAAQAPRPDRQAADERAFRRAVARELHRLHLLNWRLRQAIARGIPWAPIPHLAVIASCESGANPRAISPGGAYRGAYQFDFTTWRGVGGVGDPAAAPFPEQTYRAWLLYQRRGPRPWPVCGR